MPVQWFIKTQAGQAGPFSSEQLKQLVVEGKVTPETGLCRDTDDKWFVAKQFDGIWPGPTPPSLPEPPTPLGSSSPPQPKPAKKLPPVKRPQKMSRSAQFSASCARLELAAVAIIIMFTLLSPLLGNASGGVGYTCGTLVGFVWFFCSPLALIFGILGLRKIKRSHGQLLGRGKAQFGTTVGGIFTGLFAAGLIAFLIMAVGPVLNVSKQAQIEQIKSYVEQNKNQEAIDACTDFLKTNPGDAGAYSCRARAAMQLNNIDSAIADYAWILDAKTSTPEDKADAYFFRAGCHERKKNVSQAIADYSESIRLNPSNSQAWNNRGCLYSSQKQLDEALADFTAAIGVDKEYALAYANRADTNLAKGEYDKVVRDCTEAIRLAPRMPEVYLNRAVAYYTQEKLALALEDANKAVELAPVLGSFYLRGKIYNGLEKYKEAVSDLTEAVSMKPDAIGALLQRALAYFKLHENDKALADVNAVIQLNPNSADAYFLRSKIFESLGDEAKAKADMAKAKELNPDFGK